MGIGHVGRHGEQQEKLGWASLAFSLLSRECLWPPQLISCTQTLDRRIASSPGFFYIIYVVHVYMGYTIVHSAQPSSLLDGDVCQH